MTTFADVAALLGARSRAQTLVEGVSVSSDPRENTLVFVTRWTSEIAAIVERNPSTLFLVPSDAQDVGERENVIAVTNPRLAYALVVRDLIQDDAPATISRTAIVAETAVIGDRVSIGHYSIVEDGVVVGDRTVIDSHVVLKAGVRVGRDVRIGSHTAIGGAGFGFEMDEDGVPVRIGHRGGVDIGDSVEIGQHVAVAQGTIEPTRISDHVKIDDCVFIAHNVSIGRSSYIIAGAEISGSVVIGERAWISPEVAVINKVRIGDGALVGIGAVVINSVEDNTVVAGVPAKPRGLRRED